MYILKTTIAYEVMEKTLIQNKKYSKLFFSVHWYKCFYMSYPYSLGNFSEFHMLWEITFLIHKVTNESNMSLLNIFYTQKKIKEVPFYSNYFLIMFYFCG